MLMLKLKLQYFGYPMWRTDSLEKILLLGKIDGRKRKGWQRVRWLDVVIDSVDMSLSKLLVLVMDREVWCATIHEVAESDMTYWLNWTELNILMQKSYCTLKDTNYLCFIFHQRSESESRPVVSNSLQPWTVACQALVSTGFSRQEYWNGLPCPTPGDLPNPGIKHRSPDAFLALPDRLFTAEPPRKHISYAFGFNTRSLVDRLHKPLGFSKQ